MIQKTLIKNTDIAISRIGFGTVKFGRNQGVHYPQGFELPTDQAIINLLSLAQDLGINLLDTAPAYGTSEERLGKLLKNQREKWVISTKTGEEFQEGKSYFDFSPEATRKSIERSLKRLHTDYLDIVLVHSNGDDRKIIEEHGIFSTLNDLKKAGMIRAYGMSTKTIDGGMLAVDHSDIVMVTHNIVHTLEQPVIAHAHKHSKAVFIKKALASGHLQKIPEKNPIDAAMKFIFKEPGVSSIIVGTINPLHLQQNVFAAERALEA